MEVAAAEGIYETTHGRPAGRESQSREDFGRDAACRDPSRHCGRFVLREHGGLFRLFYRSEADAFGAGGAGVRRGGDAFPAAREARSLEGPGLYDALSLGHRAGQYGGMVHAAMPGTGSPQEVRGRVERSAAMSCGAAKMRV